MSVIGIHGLPGTGKTLFCTYLMKKKAKKENRIFKRLFHKFQYVNNVYSNYPIMLSKKHYSNQTSLYDLCEYHKWKMDSDIVLDEFQLYCDSVDFKEFPSRARTTFQLHRHFGINNIYVLSQDPSRIVKQVRQLICEFYEIVRFIKIPILGIGFFRYNIFYKDEDYSKSVKVKKEDVQYKFKKRISLPFFYRRIYKSYNTKYMRCLVDNEDYIEEKEFNDKYMNLREVSRTFKLDEKDAQESLQKELKRKEQEKRATRLGLSVAPTSASAMHCAGGEKSQELEKFKEKISKNLDSFETVKVLDMQEKVKSVEDTELALDFDFERTE